MPLWAAQPYTIHGRHLTGVSLDLRPRSRTFAGFVRVPMRMGVAGARRYIYAYMPRFA
jgi:hypothetical protein